MILKLDDHVFLTKIFFDNNKQITKYDDEYFFNIFKDIFSRIIKKYNICGNVIIDCYINNSIGIIIKINNYYPFGDKVDTKIIFHMDCLFLIKVDYFDVLDKCDYLYYYDGNFYSDILVNSYYDGEIIYDSDEIIDKGIKIYIKR